MWEIITTANPNRWRELLPASQSVFGSVEYATIASQRNGHTPQLLHVQIEDCSVVYPHFLRLLGDLRFAGDSPWEGDTFTPEYTGLLATNLTPDIIPAVQQAIAEAFEQDDNFVIAEFIHMHPWHCATELLVQDDIYHDRDIIYIDLTLSEAELWQHSFNRACRKNIRRSLKEDVHVFPATTPEHIVAFHRIYEQTMRRNNASARYFFPVDYFMAFFTDMPDHAYFALASYQDEIVAGTLYLHDDTDVYSYLGGANHEFQQVRPTNGVVYHTIQWAQGLGKWRLVLGGGYRPGDGIHRFKASFSPHRAKFSVYKHIRAPNAYDALCELWQAHHQKELNPDYFPAYRA